MSSSRSKSPLKDKPLRNPGQSLDEEISRVIEDKVSGWLIMVMFTILLAGLEWYRWAVDAPYAPLPFTVAALIMVALGWWRLAKYRREIQRLKLGRDGERAVGQYLEQLRSDGYKIFHDVVGDGFNIDHVIIGPTGIYSIETKTFSKPAAKNSRITFDGNVIRKVGIEIERDPVAQAKAQAGWLANLLKESTGRNVEVFPVILFPGWYVESNSHSSLWVLNPKGLKSFIERRAPYSTAEEVQMFSFHLSRFVRTSY